MEKACFQAVPLMNVGTAGHVETWYGQAWRAHGIVQCWDFSNRFVPSEKGRFFWERMMSGEYTGRIRFVAAPKGQAPSWVREAWIGVIVPCSPFTDTPPKGSLRGVENGEAVQSYECALVPQKAAVDALEQHNAQAAQWWRQNGFGSEFAPPFSFDVGSFEVVDGVQKAKMIVYDDMETGRQEPRDSGR